MQSPERSKIPTTPGVYFFKDAERNVLYVGKAANLRNRVASYFAARVDLGPAKQKLLTEATSITWVEVPTEIDALLTEAHYIKKYHPRFNVLLRDDKTYLSVKITDEEFPRIMPTRKIEKDGTYFGPYTDARAVRETLKTLRRYFPYRTSCKPNIGRACLDAHLGLCPGVCAGRITATEYKKNVRRIAMFLDGKRGQVIQGLKKELRRATGKSRITKRDLRIVKNIARGTEAKFEKADKLRAQIHYLETVLTMQHVLGFGEKAEADAAELARALGLQRVPERIEGYDISNFQGHEATASMVVFRGGEADKSEYKKFKIKTVHGSDDFASLRETLTRRFANHGPKSADPWPTPDLVIIDGGRPQLSAALDVWRAQQLTIPLVSLAKRYEEIFTPHSPHPLVLERTSGALHLAQRIRDEAHRFAVRYHKHLRHRKLRLAMHR